MGIEAKWKSRGIRVGKLPCGPLTLSASSHLGDMKKHRYEALIDLKPALSEEQL